MKQRSYRSFAIFRDYGYDTEEMLYRTNNFDKAFKKMREVCDTTSFKHALHLVEVQVLEKYENAPT